MKNFFKEQFTFNTVQIVTMGLLVALEVVLNRFASINLWNLKIGLAFIPVMLAGMLMGPVKAGFVAVVSDLIGALLFPSGAFFPGFTVTALLRGILYGGLLYKKPSMLNITIVAVIDQLVLSLFLTSLWLSILYSSPYMPLVVSRLVQVLPLLPIEIAVGAAMPKLIVDRLKPVIEQKDKKNMSVSF